MAKKARANPEPKERPAYFFLEKDHHIILIGILLLALVVRLLALLSLKGSAYFDFLMYDEKLYHRWAAKLADGTFESSSVYEMAPLPAYFMALIYKLFSPDVIYIRITNIVFGVLTCWIVYLIARELSKRRIIGLIACLVAALYEPFIFYSIVPLKTSMAVFLFGVTCYLLVRIVGRTSMIKALFLGIAIALANNVRPNCLALIPVIFIILFWDAYKDKLSLKKLAVTLLLYVAGLAIVQSPFIIRNYMVAGETLATPSQSGFNLFICNNFEYGYPVPFASTVPSEMGIQFTIEASRRVGKKLSSDEASRYWTNEVVQGALEQPGAFAVKQVKKMLKCFHWSEKGDHYHIGFISDYVRFFKFPFPGFWIILPFGMAGLFLNMSRSRKTLAMAVIFIVYASTLVLFFSNTRVKMPLLVILIPFAVIGVFELLDHLKNRRWRKAVIYSVFLAVFFIAEFLPMRDSGDITAYLNTHALVLNSRGLKDDAIEYWERSSSMEKHYSDFANLSLADKYYLRGDVEKAMFYLNKISDESFSAAYKHDMIGDMMFTQGQLKNAISAYEKALEFNSGLRRTRTKLIKVLWRIDKQKALEENDRLEYINSFYTLYGVKDG
jgi:4-amino-4-deoxy-L-arabinose transferase-like glycosyltransferase